MTEPTTLAGRYRLLDLIGSGGAADVWRAHDDELDATRAIKILSEKAASRSTLRRRLRAEAKVLAKLQHPHVLRVLDIGMEQGRPYIVMDLLPGGSVADRVRVDGPLAPEPAITIMLEVLSALAVAHGQGIVHRDIKPQNILLDADGRAVVADFGIALIEEGDRRTRTGVAMGSFAFMPPEQRVDAKRVGPTADLYAVGCTLFWLLTGNNPVDLFTEPDDGPRWRGLPPALVEILQWTTQSEPEDRPQSAAELAERLRALAPDEVRQRDVLDPARFPLPRQPSSQGPALGDATTALTQPTYTEADSDTAVVGVVVPPQADRSSRAWWLPAVAIVVLLGVVALVGWRLWPVDPPSQVPAPQLDRVLDPEVSTEPDEPDLGGATEVESFPPAPAAPALASTVPDTLATHWAGSFNGNPMALTLTGEPEALTGTVTTRFRGQAVHTPVRGQWDPTGATLTLVDDLEAGDAGRYQASLQAGRLSGVFQSRHRQDGSGAPMIVSFTLRPVDP